MPTRHFRYQRIVQEDPTDPLADIRMSADEISAFSPAAFGLAGFGSGVEVRHAMAAIFDLERFTDFAAQSDPHLVVPGFLGAFVDWMFDRVRTLSVEKTIPASGDNHLFAPLPFFVKFLGDGLLILWELDYGMEVPGNEQIDRNKEIQGDLGSLISVVVDICRMYTTELVPKAESKYARTPQRLRVGVAVGLVCSLAGGSDYVGPCINMAARLQKLGDHGIAVLGRGIDFSLSESPLLERMLVAKKVDVRGFGPELVYVEVPTGDLPDSGL